MSKIRQQRTAEQIRMLLSELSQRGVQDPRLLGMTVTRVTIDRELQHADVYVNALGDESRRKEVMAALQKATGFFRHELAQRMQVRTIPQLHFRWDPTLAHAETVHQILDSLEIPPAAAADEEE
ncbi:MAG: 30S ribosome-binding factor RbfA [Anaerolinea sp.]|nr:30S ribosome-binding factor RbfA [Anaerolinea sp.]